MLKALFRKQFRELGAWFYQDKRTGKNRSKAGIIGYSILYAFLCIVMSGLFFSMSSMICVPLVSASMGWLYHAIMCLIALTFGVFGSVFNTYSTLYSAKDNDLLLSMPIPPSRIILVRLFGVWFWGMVYELLVLIPAMIVYWMAASPGLLTIAMDIFIIIAISILVLVISCALGWLVAKISSRLRSKSLVTVLISVVFLGVYFYIYSSAYSMLQKLIANIETVGLKIRSAIYPIYLMGRGAEGDGLAFLLFLAMVLALFGLVWWILSHSFLKLATTRSGAAKKKYREISIKARSVYSALLHKEGRRFTSSAAYMLNCGMGTLFIAAIAVVVLIKGEWIRNTVAASFAEYDQLIPLIAIAILCMMTTMNELTAPSISLEGKNLWLMQALPISAWQVLKAKLELHLLLTELPTLLCSICMAVVIRPGLMASVLMVVLPQLFVILNASLGLILNLKSPNLAWTNETAVVKQSMSVGISLFGGWIMVIFLGVLYAAVGSRLTVELFMLIVSVLLALLSALALLWLKKRGTRIFEAL